jgi:hypothetical protein
MEEFEDKPSLLSPQIDRENKNHENFQKKVEQILDKSTLENPDCTCYTGKCGCDDNQRAH